MITQTTLSKSNVMAFKNVFKQSFPNESWRQSVPFKTDPVFAAVDESGQVQGFCMVHSSPPYKFPTGEGAFLYNLCVAPEYRRKGVATAIVQYVLQHYPRCHTQTFCAEKHLCEWFAARGWKRVGTFRNKYADFSHESMVPKELEKNTDELADLEHYDPIENVIYLSSRY